jgi:hypothetical protein
MQRSVIVSVLFCHCECIILSLRVHYFVIASVAKQSPTECHGIASSFLLAMTSLIDATKLDLIKRTKNGLKIKR